MLAILGDFGGEDTQTVVTQLLKKLRALTGPDEKRLRECLAMLEILADNRHLNLNFQEAYAMLQIDLERLPSYQKGLEKGMEKGIEKGIEKGLREALDRLVAGGIPPAQARKLLGLD